MTDPITDFRGDYRWLSNFHRCEIHFEHLIYPSTEHAYQAAKTLDPETRMLFTDLSMTCRDAKRAGGALELRPDWETVKDKVMRAVCFDKFARHLGLRDMLIGTGDAELIEENQWGDTYWGVCRGEGQNRLGVTLMDIRAFFIARAANG